MEAEGGGDGDAGGGDNEDDGGCTTTTQTFNTHHMSLFLQLMLCHRSHMMTR